MIKRINELRLWMRETGYDKSIITGVVSGGVVYGLTNIPNSTNFFLNLINFLLIFGICIFLIFFAAHLMYNPKNE